MNDLITRLEVASRGDRDLDMDIAKALGFRPIATIRGVQIHNPQQPSGVSWDLPHYTTSVDAALKMVPPEWRVYAIQEHHVDQPVEWFAGLDRRREHKKSMIGHAPTPALALCIAALKARAC